MALKENDKHHDKNIWYLHLVNLLKLNISIIVHLLARNKKNVHNASVSIRTWSWCYTRDVGALSLQKYGT